MTEKKKAELQEKRDFLRKVLKMYNPRQKQLSKLSVELVLSEIESELGEQA